MHSIILWFKCGGLVAWRPKVRMVQVTRVARVVKLNAEVIRFINEIRLMRSDC